MSLNVPSDPSNSLPVGAAIARARTASAPASANASAAALDRIEGPLSQLQLVRQTFHWVKDANGDFVGEIETSVEVVGHASSTGRRHRFGLAWVRHFTAILGHIRMPGARIDAGEKGVAPNDVPGRSESAAR